MHTSITNITIPPRRQRSSMKVDDLKGLAASIKDLGLLHPVVVRPIEGEVEKYELVCGERRLKACTEILQWDLIPITPIENLDPIMRHQAELEENILREDLNWKDRLRAVNELHELRTQQNPRQTVMETAKELAEVKDIPFNTARAEVTRARIVAQHLGSNAIAGARNAKEAYDIISRQNEAIFQTQLARVSGVSSPHTFIQGSCIEFLSQYSGPGFDLVLADPPYGVGADDFGDAGGTHTYADDEETARAVYKAILEQGARVTKTSAHLYLFCDIDWFALLRASAEKYGWHPFRTPIIWNKGGALGHDPNPGFGFKRTYECILFAWKGEKRANTLVGDVIDVPPVRDKGHAAQKPVELYRRLISRSCQIGDTILDPCCGTGTVFPAATACKVMAIGIENNVETGVLAKARLTAKE